jgi:hypothetical protein
MMSLFRRIPNSLDARGNGAGTRIPGLRPDGEGLFPRGSGLGIRRALLGGLDGLACSCPCTCCGCHGAGDVKLVAMIGIWLGAPSVARDGVVDARWPVAFSRVAVALGNRRAAARACQPARDDATRSIMPVQARADASAMRRSRRRRAGCPTRWPSLAAWSVELVRMHSRLRRRNTERLTMTSPARCLRPQAARSVRRSASRSHASAPRTPEETGLPLLLLGRARAEGDAPARHHAPARAGRHT